MESQLRGVFSGQPQLFAEIARSHDLRALPEHSENDRSRQVEYRLHFGTKS
jgi:hypothetical protein